MTLLDFLILILDAHAQSLKRLAALFGEALLIEILENSDETGNENSPLMLLDPTWFDENAALGMASYAQLEGAVREFDIPETLEFYLWAYPMYRAFIESPLELGTRLSNRTVLSLADRAVSEADLWMKNLRIAPEFRKQAESAAQVPWIRFRTDFLKRSGLRPIGAI